MIVQRTTQGGLRLFRQTDHALLAAGLAARWGGEGLAPFVHRDSCLVAAARHDDGWAAWELTPRLTADGVPVDFLSIPVAEHVELYGRGIDLVEAEDPYAACMSSLHGKRLYTRVSSPDGPPRYTRLPPGDRAVAEAFVSREVQRQRRLVAGLAASLQSTTSEVREDLQESWRLLQVWDRISLFLCLSPAGMPIDLKLPPVRGADGSDVEIAMRSAGDGVVTLHPYPFTSRQLTMGVCFACTAAASWETESAFLRDYRTAQRHVAEFTFQPR